jgi:hypothetical protein
LPGQALQGWLGKVSLVRLWLVGWDFIGYISFVKIDGLCQICLVALVLQGRLAIKLKLTMQFKAS